MPILFSYDITNAQSVDHNRLQSMFQRFGWENIGGSCYRYPKLPPMRRRAGRLIGRGTRSQTREDWLDEVIPALMCFRAYVKKRRLRVAKYSLDSHVSTGAKGIQPMSGSRIHFHTSSSNAFGAKNLRDWIDHVSDGIPY